MLDRPVAGAAEAGPAGRARLLWTLFEPIHGVTYFAAAARPWSRLDRAAAAEFGEALRPIARACAVDVSFPAKSGASGTSGS